MISLSRNFLFVHIPRTGGNSIQSVLGEFSEDSIEALRPHQDGVERFSVKSERYGTQKHSTLAEYSQRIESEVFDGLRKFAVVRNPWDRVLSHYFFEQSRNQFEAGKSYSELVEPKLCRESFRSLISRVETVNHYVTRFPSDGLVDVEDRGFHFLRFENLQSDFDELCARLDLPRTALPTRNRTRHRHFSRYYDEASWTAVERRFAEEIEFFGYS